MKVIVIDRILADGSATEATAVEYLPDSTVLPCNKPFFIPEIPGPWSFRAYPVFRVSRLGKSIAERFAHRYYDAVTVALRPSTESYPSQFVNGMDGEWIIGEWAQPDWSKPLTIDLGDNATIELTPQSAMIDETIATMSRLMTLKMGDQIAPCRFDIRFPAIPDTRLTARINNIEILNAKIK